MDCSTPGFPVHHQLLEFIPTHVHLVDDAIQPSHPLLPPSPAFNLSQHQVLFQRVSYSHQVAKVLEFQVNQSFQRIFRIDFLRMDWLDLLAVQEILKNLLQHHSSKVSILLHSAFFIVELGNPEIDPHIWIILGFLTTKVWFIYWLYSWSACRIRSVKEDSMRDKIALIASDSTAWVHMNI